MLSAYRLMSHGGMKYVHISFKMMNWLQYIYMGGSNMSSACALNFERICKIDNNLQFPDISSGRILCVLLEGLDFLPGFQIKQLGRLVHRRRHHKLPAPHARQVRWYTRILNRMFKISNIMLSPPQFYEPPEIGLSTSV